jgi:hypothetical protein
MKTRAWLLVFAICVSSRAVPMQVISSGYGSGDAYVTCVIDGVKERCFLDTGSPLTIVPNSKRYASYTNLGAFHFKSAADIAQEIETIRVGSIEVDGTVFPRVKVGRANFHGAENTLGIDLLGQQPFAIRFKPKPSLELNAGRPERTFATLEVSKQGLLAIPIEVGGSEVRALWDTGVSITTVDQGFVAAHPENFKAMNKYANGFDGAGKPMFLQIFRAKKIAIAGRAFEDVRVVAADLSVLRDNSNKDIQAVVGFNLIRKGDWFFDTRNRLWSFQR